MTQKLLMAMVVGLLLDVPTVWAQDTGSGAEGNPNLIWNATRGGSLGSRSPGRLVSNGRDRHNGFLKGDDVRHGAFNRPDITQQPEDPTLSTQLKVQFIQTLFNNLNAALLLFDNLIRAQAGFPPFVPAPITPNTSTTLTTGGTSGSLPDLSNLGNLAGP
ncbi:MAG: hypothetical protein ACE5GE_04615 [Phycisphaerae bacterium]